MVLQELINDIVENAQPIDIEKAKKYLQKAYEMANERSLSNLIRNFGFQENKFFPNTTKKKFDYYDMMFAIPKTYENRYAKMWISLFPARVKYLTEVINNNINAIQQNMEKIRQYVMENKTLRNEIKSLFLKESDISNGLIMANFLKDMYKILSEFRRNTENISNEQQFEKLLDALEELQENYLYGPIDKVFIQSIGFNFPERSSIFVSTNETIPFIQFWGSSVFAIRISGLMPNTINIDSKNIIIKEWFAKIRGTQLAKNYCALFLDFEDNILTLYPTDFSFSQNSHDIGSIGFSIGGYLTRIIYSPIETPITDNLNSISRGMNNKKYEYFIKPKMSNFQVIET